MPLPLLVWTALPNGVSAAGYRLSVFLAPRLEGPDPELGAYQMGIPDAVGFNWPGAVANLGAASRLWLQVNNATAPMIPLSIDSAVLEPGLWRSLFPSTTRVGPFAFSDEASRPLYSFSVGALESYIASLYADIGNLSATEFPDLKTGRLRELAEAFQRARRVMYDALDDVPPQGGGPHPDFNIEGQLDGIVSPVPLKEFYRAFRFYRRGNQEDWGTFGYRSQHEPVLKDEVPEPIRRPSFEFHEVLAMLGDHPYLLRALGLLIDCQVSVADLGGALPATGRLRLQVDWGHGIGAPKDRTPWTVFEVDTAGFRPMPKNGSDIQAGLLRLADTSRFGVFQTDVDGNALKTLDFAFNMADVLHGLETPAAGETEPWVPLSEPAPESLPAQRNGGFTLVRHARDEKIHSDLVSQRNANATLADANLFYDDVARGYRVDVLDRGFWRSLCHRQGDYALGAATFVPPGPDEGYVKAASATSDPPHKPKASLDSMYLHEAVFGWDNWSLVVPRPGRSISFHHDEATRTQTFEVARTENEPDPDFPILPRFKVVPKSLPMLRFGESYAFRARVVDLAGNSLPYRNADFDGAFWKSETLRYLRSEPIPAPVLVLREVVTPGESVEHLVIRSKVTSDTLEDETKIFNAECRRFVAPPKVSQAMAEQHKALDALWSDPDKTFAISAKESGSFNDPAPDLKIYEYGGKPTGFPPKYIKGDPLPNGTYTVHTGSTLDLPYLPEPLSVGLVFQGFPGAPAHERLFAGISAWPGYEPFPLTLERAAGSAPLLAPLPDFVRIALPRGTMLTVKYSSAITPPGLDQMARFHALNPAMQADVLSRANQHWMITPPRSLTFVHAVEKPLNAPAIESLTPSRNPAETFVTFRQGTFSCHSNSTGRIELFADWNEWVDRLDEPKPKVLSRQGRILDKKVTYDAAIVLFYSGKGEPPRHEFGDTKHRRVSYYPVGTTRYREYFPASITDHEQLISVKGDPFEHVDIPSSAHPDAPRILYIVPTFEWVDGGGGTSRTRVGRGLRIYLDRPWYSSGDGELLGIVIPRAGESDAEARRFASQWGADPMYSSTGPLTDIALSSFVAASTEFEPVLGSSLRLHERAGSTSRVDVVAFAPRYDEQRQVHYVDIVMDPGVAFQPFVRLSLVRYQPISLPDLHLSRVVRTEFAQLLADRTASLTYVGTSELEITLTGLASRNALGARLPLPLPGPVLPAPLPGPTSSPSGPVALAPSFEPGVFFIKDPTVGAGRLVRVHFERLDTSASDDFGWTMLPGEWILESHKSLATPELVLWQGKLPLPPGRGTDGKRYRVVIREFELFQTDDATRETLPVFNPGGIPLRARLVFADRFELVG